MTGAQLIARIKAQVNQLDTASNRTLRPELALLFANDAYRKLVRAKYRAGSSVDESAFQLVQLDTDDLNHITVVSGELDVEKDTLDDGYYIPIDNIEGYWIHLRTRVKVKHGTTTKWRNNLSYKTIDTVGTSIEDPFNKATFLEPIVYFEDNKIKFPATDFEVLKCSISYIKRIEPITLNDEVLAPFEDEIIDSAATQILENWGDPRTSSKMTVDKVLKSE